MIVQPCGDGCAEAFITNPARGTQIRFPARNWSDLEGNVTNLGPTTWHGTPVDVLAFVDLANGAYHRLWVDHANRILHERMDAPGHFMMDRDYTDTAFR